MKYIKIIDILSRFVQDKPRFRSFLHRCSIYVSRLNMLMPDEVFARKMYKRYTGNILNLNNPQTFNEKLWWMKLYYHDPLQTRCTDKILVRDYVKECGYKDILTNLYGVYKTAGEVNFDSFTEETFLKCNHSSGTNIIYIPSKGINRKKFISDFKFDLRQNHYYQSREWNYKNIEPCIIAEQVLRDKEGNLPVDYKFMCFAGIPKLLFIEGNVCDENGKRNTTGSRFVNVYDMDFRLTPITSGTKQDKEVLLSKPKNFELMKKIASRLSEPFPHCRIDLFNIDGNIYFGEITFYHGGGCINIQPEEWALKMGEWIVL